MTVSSFIYNKLCYNCLLSWRRGRRGWGVVIHLLLLRNHRVGLLINSLRLSCVGHLLWLGLGRVVTLREDGRTVCNASSALAGISYISIVATGVLIGAVSLVLDTTPYISSPVATLIPSSSTLKAVLSFPPAVTVTISVPP